MELRMTSQPALLAAQTTDAKLGIRQKKADQEIHQDWPQTHVELSLPKVLIDQSQCFAESGLKPIAQLIAENAQYGVRKMYESIGRIAQQGTDLSNIQNSGNQIVEQAIFNSSEQFATDYNMVTMPQSRPKYTIQEGKNYTQISGGPISHKSRVNPPEFEYQDGKVDIYLKQRNSLTIDVVPSKLDQKL